MSTCRTVATSCRVTILPHRKFRAWAGETVMKTTGIYLTVLLSDIALIPFFTLKKGVHFVKAANAAFTDSGGKYHPQKYFPI